MSPAKGDAEASMLPGGEDAGGDWPSPEDDQATLKKDKGDKKKKKKGKAAAK